MAKTSALREGMQCTITAGPFENRKAIIVNPVAVPDGHPSGQQRKILVQIDGVEQPEYILPRLIQTEEEVRQAQAERMLAEAQASVGPMAALTHNQMAQAQSQTAIAQVLRRAEPITDPMDPVLDQFRPSTHVVEAYVGRTVPGGMTDIEYMLALREDRDVRGYSPNVALVGETQSGKTMLVEVLACIAAERDGLPKPYPVFTLSGSTGITSYDLYGQTTAVEINGQEVLVWMEGLVPLALKCGGFLYLDEWNAVPPNQAVAIHPILDDRRRFVNTQRAVEDGHGGYQPEVVQAHPKTWVVSTINPGYKGTQTASEATSNRFRWVPWDYDQHTEQILVPSTTCRLIGEALRNLRVSRTVTVPVGTSALQRLYRDCTTFGVEAAMWSFLAIFPPNERSRVEVVISDRGFLDTLYGEFPNSKQPVEASATDDDDA